MKKSYCYHWNWRTCSSKWLSKQSSTFQSLGDWHQNVSYSMIIKILILNIFYVFTFTLIAKERKNRAIKPETVTDLATKVWKPWTPFWFPTWVRGAQVFEAATCCLQGYILARSGIWGEIKAWTGVPNI